MSTDTAFRPVGCRRCGAVVLAGHCDGLPWRMDSHAVPRDHALILKTYGISVLIMDLRLSGPYADIWVPDAHDLDRPHRYLVAPHVCGSAHARRSTKENA